MINLQRYKRELSAAAALVLLLLVVAVVAPSFFAPGNLRDLVVNNAPTLIVAIGITMVIIAGQIDISVGSQYAVCSVAAGLFAKAGVPMFALVIPVLALGAAMGALNGFLIGRLQLPSIIVTLAMLVIWRDGLRWTTEGAWVQSLPDNFQWFGLGQTGGEFAVLGVTAILLIIFGWALRYLAAGRMIYAVGSDAEAARLAGIQPRTLVFLVFTLTGSLVGIAGLLNAVRFSSIPGNAGVGLELKAIAAVVVGGTAITGGRGTLVGTLIGVLLLGTIGTALTFVGVNPFWEKAIQGAIILVALVSDVALSRFESNGKLGTAAAGA